MKKAFFLGCLGLALFEAANVYFIMPMPGSQGMESIAVAYFLHKWRWTFRAIFGFLILFGLKRAFFGQKRTAVAAASVILLVALGVAYLANFEMAADTMFLQPNHLLLKKGEENKVAADRLVLGIERGGAARAYPIQFLGYHHQVFDTLGGRPVIVTYCTVCRTGRVFEPTVDGQTDRFRLVGMDHFNAMFEDSRTGSWWRQATGEAVAGPLAGSSLPEVPSQQATLGKWLELFPNSLVMQPDADFKEEYDSLANYETGKRKGKLTRRDTLSWQPKSWVVGLELDGESLALDWNHLQKERVLSEKLAGKEVFACLAADGASFAAFAIPAGGGPVGMTGDTIGVGAARFNFLGKPFGAGLPDLERVAARQEYWAQGARLTPDAAWAIAAGRFKT